MRVSVGAGTVEFIMDAETGEYFFMEMYVLLTTHFPLELLERPRCPGSYEIRAKEHRLMR